MNWPRILAYGLVLILCAGILELDGYRRGERKLWEYQAKQATEAVRIVTKRGEVTDRVVTKYVKVAGATQVVTNTIEKEVVRYAESNAGACLDDRWRRLHDAAALNAVPESARDDDGRVRAPGPNTAGPGDDGFQRARGGDAELREAPPLR